MFKLFSKKLAEPYKRFGRVVTFDSARCDVCGKRVFFSDHIYLCKDCFDKLPAYAQRNHHWLVEFVDARKEYLCNAILQSYGISEEYYI